MTRNGGRNRIYIILWILFPVLDYVKIYSASLIPQVTLDASFAQATIDAINQLDNYVEFWGKYSYSTLLE